MSGLPTIASRIEGIYDVIAEGVNGHLMDSGNRRAFAAAIQRYYGQEHLLGDMAQRTVQYAQRFSWPAISQAYVDLCRALCRRGPTVAL